jgi:glycerol-3-phosphate dehydrogenase
LIAAYGTRFPDVLAVADARPDWRTRLAHDSPVIGAELIWAVRHEMALTLCDAVVRRTSLGALGYPGDAAADKSAGIAGTELKWAPDRIRDELAALRSFYAPL